MPAWQRLALVFVMCWMVCGCKSPPPILPDVQLDCLFDPEDLEYIVGLMPPTSIIEQYVRQNRFLDRFIDTMALCLEITGQATR